MKKYFPSFACFLNNKSNNVTQTIKYDNLEIGPMLNTKTLPNRFLTIWRINDSIFILKNQFI